MIRPTALMLALATLSIPAGAQPVGDARGQAVVKVALVDADAMPDFRDRLMSALLEGGVRLSTTSDGRDVPVPTLIVSARVQPGGMTASVASGSGYCVGGTRLSATVDLRVRDAASGAVAWGGVVPASVTVGSDVVAGRRVGADDCGSMTPASADYRRLTTTLALATARRIAFQIAPLRVAAVEGRSLVLDRGAPLVPLGAMVQVAGIGGAPVLYRVTAATPASATATPYGTPAAIAPGAIARILENDDPAAHARRFEKVDLP
ncbi:MAG: hypothetical protein FJ335_06505 [Sphingomonadales bacterium]|nr:hypothetical protein [Sphingomonadales bacterium]